MLCPDSFWKIEKDYFVTVDILYIIIIYIDIIIVTKLNPPAAASLVYKTVSKAVAS